jgi:Mg2+ and Co2+ transporter CorA
MNFKPVSDSHWFWAALIVLLSAGLILALLIFGVF